MSTTLADRWELIAVVLAAVVGAALAMWLVGPDRQQPRPGERSRHE